MTVRISVRKMAGVAVWAMAALGGVGSASAQNVYWSVGVASPGVQVAVSNAPAVAPHVVYQRPYVVAHAQPVYVQPQPVYVQPAPVLSAYPIYGRPVVIQQAPVVLAGWQRPHHHGWHHGRHREGHHGQGQMLVQPTPRYGHGGGHPGAHY